jgi:hypothetical protein
MELFVLMQKSVKLLKTAVGVITFIKNVLNSQVSFQNLYNNEDY